MSAKGKTVFKPQHSVRRDTGELQFFLFPMHMLQGMPGEVGMFSKPEKELSQGAEFSGKSALQNCKRIRCSCFSPAVRSVLLGSMGGLI